MLEAILTRVGWPKRWQDVTGEGEYREVFWCPSVPKPNRWLVVFAGMNGGLIALVIWTVANYAPK